MKLLTFLVGVVVVIAVIFLINLFLLQKEVLEPSEESKTIQCLLYMDGEPEMYEFPCTLADMLEVSCDTLCEGLCNESIENLDQNCLEWDVINKNVSA